MAVMLLRGNSAQNAPAFRDAGTSQTAFPRWNVRNDKINNHQDEYKPAMALKN